MNPNEQLIHTFYKAFQQKDYATMQKCYADNATFSDEAFVDLNAEQVRAMWEMLIKRGKDLVLEYDNVYADDKRGSATWIATYSFSASGRKVVNKIQAEFVFEHGKIIKHRDHFDFYTWSKQALGLTGFLLGKTNFLKHKIQQKAKAGLLEYMKKKDAQ